MRSSHRRIVVALGYRDNTTGFQSFERALAEHGIGCRSVVNTAEAEELYGSANVSAFLIAHSTSDPLQVEKLVAAVRRSHPHVPILCGLDHARGSALHLHRLHRLARAGADDVMLEEGDAGVRETAQVIADSASHLLPHKFVSELVTALPSSARPMVSWGLRRAWKPIRAREFAAYFGVNRKTIYLRLTRLGLPTIATIGRYCRLAHVCVLLDDTYATESTIARRLMFGSDASMQMLVRRELHVSVTSIRGAAAASLYSVWRAKLIGSGDSAPHPPQAVG